MKHVQVAYERFSKKRFPLPTEDHIVGCERRLGIPFPDDFREYLIMFNGGYFDDPVIVLPGDSGSIDGVDSLDVMYGIAAEDEEAELATENSLEIFEDNDPPLVIPIGYTVMGGLLLLATGGEDDRCIVLGKAYADDVVWLADGIDEFFALLRAAPDRN